MNRNNKNCIILIKNFHKIHEDLLTIFYSFLQNNDKYNLKFIILTQNYKFITKNILNNCLFLRLKEVTTQLKDLKQVNKENFNNNYIFYDNYIEDTNKWIYFIVNFKENYLIYNKEKENLYKVLREIIYEILIKNYDINIVTSYVIFSLINLNIIKDNELLIQKYYNFIKLYNNNYRPIYHLEKFTLELIDNLKN